MMNKPGAVKITLQTNNSDVDEKAEVTVALSNPEMAVEKMIHTLAQRFPPESVMTIQPTKGGRSGDNSTSSSVPTASRSSSRSTTEDPTVHLSPEARAGLNVFPPELTNWVLATNPTIVRALLPLALDGGNTLEFANRHGLSHSAVDQVAKALFNDSDFYIWVDILTNNVRRNGTTKQQSPSHHKKLKKSASKSPTGATEASFGSPPGASPHSATGHNSPKYNNNGRGEATQNWPVDPARAGKQMMYNNTPFKLEADRIPRNPNKLSEGYWLVSPDGALIGHTDAQNRSIMHPQRPFPAGAGQPTGVNGINIVSRDASAPELGGPWLIDHEGGVVGHFDIHGHPVLHPNFKCRFDHQVPSPVPGYHAVYMDPEKPQKGVWLLDNDGNVVSHVGPDGIQVNHPLIQLNPDTPSALRGVHTVNRNPARPELGGPWLVDDNGLVIGHWGPDGRVVLHPLRRRSARSLSPAGGIGSIHAEQSTELNAFVPTVTQPLHQTSSTMHKHKVTSQSGNTPAPPQPSSYVEQQQQQNLHHHQSTNSGGYGFSSTAGGDSPSNARGPAYGGNGQFSSGMYGGGTQFTHTHQHQLQQPSTSYQNSGHHQFEEQRTVYEPATNPPPTGTMPPPAGPNERIEYDEDGNRTRYVEVEVVQYVVKEVPIKETREIIRKVPKQEVVVREQRVDDVQITYEEKQVEKLIEEEVVVKVPRKEIVTVPKEVIKTVKREEVVTVEKIVEEPEIIEVQRPYVVEQKVPVTRFVNREQPTMVAQKLKPVIRGADKPKVVDAKLYEPMLYAVDVFVPKPVTSSFIPLGKVDETHNMIEIPAPQFNSLLKAMNANKPPEALTDLYVRGVGGTIPLLPVGELTEIVPPLPSAFQPAPSSAVRHLSTSKRERGGHHKSSHKRRSHRRH